ncbi:hypothetical protein BDV09DRAFT_200579 [Aspergillus tetrazonus]
MSSETIPQKQKQPQGQGAKSSRWRNALGRDWALVSLFTGLLTAIIGWWLGILNAEMALEAPFGFFQRIDIDSHWEEHRKEVGKNCPVVQDSYGVTEISACTTFQTMSASQLEETRSVGRTISNTSLYIVNPDCKLVAIGEAGETCIGGAGVALGYLNEE